MTTSYPERLYYADSYITEFDAQVVERLDWEGNPAVVLNHTAFYPSSGGQPSDLGAICDTPVIGVEIRELDGAIVHILQHDLPIDSGAAQIDWARRFDHMQQHSGQHLLSAACEQLLDADTVAFHLGTQVCTIDLDQPRLPTESLGPVEELVNRIIWEDRPTIARFASPSQVAELSLRHPPKVDGPVRLVEVADFDINPCGGTHVARTGEIGLLKIIRTEHRGEETRVEFLCGKRALSDYDTKNQTLLQLAGHMTVGYWELENAIARLQDELKQTRRQLRSVQEESIRQEAALLRHQAADQGSPAVIRKIWEERNPGDLRSLAQELISSPETVVVLASIAERTHVCIARSEGLDVDAPMLLQQALGPLGGKGGGQPHLAQGSAPPTERSALEHLLLDLTTDM